MTKDVISITIIKNSLDSIAREMFWATVNSSKSPLINDTYDFATGLTDGKGNLISMGQGTPVFLGMMSIIATAVMEDIKKYDLGLNPGDIFVINDPYRISTHLNDVALAMPIFYQDKIIAISTVRGHTQDIGGMNPGGVGPNTTSIYQEGLIVPTCHFYKDGKLNKEVVNMMMSNSRVPDLLYGDLESFSSSLRFAYARVNELCDKYGANSVCEAMDDKINKGRISAKNALKKLKKGEFFAEERIKKFPGMKEDIKIKTKVKITDDKFIVDFTGNPPQMNVPINTTFAGIYTSAVIIFSAIVDPHESINQGHLESIDVICPEGNVFNALFPAPTSCYWETLFYAADLIWKALVLDFPDRLTAGHFLSVVTETISGIDPRDGKYKILNEPNPGGWGAGIDKDGESCLVSIADGEMLNHPVEVLEINYPIRVECMRLNLEGGIGHGTFRGGFGMIKDYRIFADGAILMCSINKTKYPPWGVNGGGDGSINHIVIIRDDKAIWDGGRLSNFMLKKDDIVRIISGGGAGWGDPLERDPYLVLEDYKNGLISLNTAKENYGVIIPNKDSVDMESTKILRERMRKKGKECVI